MSLLLTLLLSLISHASPWDELLANAHLQRSDIAFDALDLKQVGGAEAVNPTYEYLHGDPLRIPFFARVFRDSALQNAKSPYALAGIGANRLGLLVRRMPDQKDDLTAIEKSTDQDLILQAIESLHKIGGRPLNAKSKAELKARLENLAPELRLPVGKLLAVEALALKSRASALKSFAKKDLKAAFNELLAAPDTDPNAQDQPVGPMIRRLMKEADLRVLLRGGLELAHGVQTILPEVKSETARKFNWGTPFGEIIVDSTKTNNVYHADHNYLLLIDTQGDDIYYAGGGTADAEHPVSVLIDLAGNDQYLAAPALAKTEPWDQAPRKAGSVRPVFGGAILGYGITVDVAGDDVYKSFRQSEGHGNFGVGLLWDRAGKNRFECWTQCQGSGEFGVGVLLDEGGDDSFTAMQMAQGFGGLGGAGLLIKPGEGNDTYLGLEKPLDFISPVDPKRGESFVQGAALGRRAEFLDGFSIAGGFGALVDGGGKNTYQAGFFAQGVGYWYGVGLLSGGPGDDRYRAGKYALGAATHFAVGILHETGGNDDYDVEQELGLGHGHDYAVGFFMDNAGDDVYRAPNFSLGCASAEGIGVFWDRAGDDKYSSDAKDTLGCAAPRIGPPSLRYHSRTTGLFLDTGGKNQFVTKLKEPNGRESSTHWTHASAEVEKDAPEAYRFRFVGAGLVTGEDYAPDPE